MTDDQYHDAMMMYAYYEEMYYNDRPEDRPI